MSGLCRAIRTKVIQRSSEKCGMTPRPSFAVDLLSASNVFNGLAGIFCLRLCHLVVPDVVITSRTVAACPFRKGSPYIEHQFDLMISGLWQSHCNNSFRTLQLFL